MDKDVRDALQKRAVKLGFDSAQAYIRVWAKAEVDGRDLNFGEDNWGEPSAAAAKRLDRDVEEATRAHKAGQLPTFTNDEDAIKHLHNL